MEKRVLTDKKLSQFFTYLKNEEKSENTISKYMRDVKMFALYMNGSELAKDAVIAYKNKLIREDYAPRSINSTLASLNSFFVFLGRPDLKVKSIRLQHRVFCSAEKELTKEEYKKLVKAAVRSGNERLSLIIQTICSTGIRVSELPFITVEAVKKRGGNCVTQRKNTYSIYCSTLAKRIAPLYQYAQNKRRICFCNAQRNKYKPYKYMERNEKTLH